MSVPWEKAIEVVTLHLSMDDGMLSIDDDFAWRRYHEGGHQWT